MSNLGTNISNYLTENFGLEFKHQYEEYIKSSPNYYLRIHPGISHKELISSLKKYDIEVSKLETFPNSYEIIKGSEKAGKTLEFTLGQYYIQSLSSMIPPMVLAPNEDETVLDLCAAPGSKTTQLSEMMDNKGTLYANEVSVPRLRGLVHNLDKINTVNTGVLNYKGELLSKLFTEYFDKILVDAPCSALGIINKKGEVTDWWSQNRLEGIYQTQLKLLISAIKMAKVGAEIVYSTCTMTLEENEAVVQKVLDKYPVILREIKLPVKSNPGITEHKDFDLTDELSKCHRIIPWEINSEGFFVCKFLKTDQIAERSKDKSFSPKGMNYNLINSDHKDIKSQLQYLSEWFGIDIKILNNFKYVVKNREIFFVNDGFQVDSLTPFNRVGTKFGKFDKHRNAILNTLSAQLLAQYATQNIVILESLEQLTTYMHGQIIKKEFGNRGQKIVKYKDYNLGTAIQTEQGLKSQYPRAMRTSEILIR